MRGCLVLIVLLQQVFCLPPNFEDLDLSIDQPVGEKVDISQQDPQSNAIHIGHNNPKDSDISVEQINPFNTTVHISLNVGTGSKVTVKMQNARNLQLHVSFNGMGNSECTVEIEKAFNSTVHLSFQNPSNTPVTVKMNQAEISNLHVSQNIPKNSPMMVTMDDAKNCQIHLSQAVPINSPLTWKLNGDPDINQIEVAQNAADANSPLDCTPECPQEEYVYEYQYAGSDNSQLETDSVDVEAPSQPAPVQDYQNSVQQDYYQVNDYNIDDNKIIIEDYQVTDDVQSVENEINTSVQYPEQDDIPALPSLPSPTSDTRDYEEDDDISELGSQCPGDNLETCVDVCPGEFGPRVYGACVTSCGKRCP